MTEDSRQSFDFKAAQLNVLKVHPEHTFPYCYGDSAYSFVMSPPSALELTIKHSEGKVTIQTPPNWNIGEKEFSSWKELNDFVLELKFAGIKAFGVEDFYANRPRK
jgi:hypothetical protein